MGSLQNAESGFTLLKLDCQRLLLLLLLVYGGMSNTDKLMYPSIGQWLNGLLGEDSAKLRPVADWRSSVPVRVDLSILSVIGMDEKNERLILYVLYTQGWKDERLKWDSSQYGGVLRVTISADKIWVPDIILYEMANTEESLERNHLSVTHDGWVELRKPRLLECNCPLNLYHFPLDQHACNLTFLSQSHIVREVEVYWGDTGHDGLFSRGEWEVLSLAVTSHFQTAQHFNTSAVRVQVSVRRSPLLYMVTLLLPSALLLVLDMLAFLIPVYLEQRLSVMVTVYTGHFIFIIIIFTLFPPFTLQLPLIEIYLFGSLVLLALSSVETVVLFRLVNGRDSWIRKRVCSRLPRPKGRDHWQLPDVSGRSKCACFREVECAHALRVELTHVRHFLQRLRQERNELSMCRELGKTIDRFYLYLHCFVLTAGAALLYCEWRATQTPPHNTQPF